MDFLKYSNRCRKPIILSIQDFVGLSSGINDFKQFLNITHVHIDLAPVKNCFEYIFTQKIIDNDTVLAIFNYCEGPLFKSL
jgi:hypothetical protein